MFPLNCFRSRSWRCERIWPCPMKMPSPPPGITSPESFLTKNKLDDSALLYCEALATREKLNGPNHASVATTLRNYGRTLQAQGKIAQAEAMYRGALAIRLKLFPETHAKVVESQNDLIELVD